MKDTSITPKTHPRIDSIEETTDTLTSRAGLALFARYLDSIGLSWFVERWFGPIRKSGKGVSAVECLRQVILFMADGTSRHLSHFDRLKADEGYAATLERRPADLVSSHSVKRFFGAISWARIWLLRKLLQELFLWRLNIEKPSLVVLDVDAMVMDNDEAEKRQGVRPTYKRVKGFAPLQMSWGRMVVDAVFRAGNHHSNHKDTTEKMVTHMVAKIRRRYSATVPIVIRQDAGYCDQKLFELYESLGVGYVSGGKLCPEIKESLGEMAAGQWRTYENAEQEWSYLELGDSRKSWRRFRRAIFCRPAYEDRQRLLEFARPDTLIYTNIGIGEPVGDALVAAGYGHLLTPAGIIECYHDRGSAELIHRAFKDFVDQRLPFKGFRQNTAFYYVALLAFALYESFKADVTDPVVPPTAYPTTFRRRFLDVAGKIVRHAGRIVLKVTRAAMDGLKLAEVWQRCLSPPRIPRPV